jgi:heme/copper-type cytochrome/quinol oxidase subunit 2
MANRLEVAWTLAVVALLAGVAAYSTVLLYQIDALPSDPTEYVTVIGHQWYWEFCYASNESTVGCFNSTYNAQNNTVSGGALWATPGAVVQINVTGADVIHSFNIPQLGVRIDAIPGRTNYFAFNVPNVAVGTQYLIQCTEFCGEFHGTMRSFLIVT